MNYFKNTNVAFAFESHTYITYMIGHYNPSVRIIDLVSHTIYVVCVNFLYISGGTYSLKSTPNDRFWETIHGHFFIYSQSFCQKSAERKSPKKYFFVFRFDVWPGTRTLAFRLINQHTTYKATVTSSHIVCKSSPILKAFTVILAPFLFFLRPITFLGY